MTGPRGDGPPAALLRAVALGWEGLVAVEEPPSPGDPPLMLLHVGPAPDPLTSRLTFAVRPGGPGPPRFLRMWLSDVLDGPDPPLACTTDMAYAAGRRRLRRLAEHGTLVVWTARPGDTGSVRCGRVVLSAGARRFLLAAVAKASEHFVSDPPPFGIGRRRWRLLAEHAPCLTEAGDDRGEVLVVIPADRLRPSAAPAGAVSFDVLHDDGRVVLETRLWRPDRQSAVAIDITGPDEHALALHLAGQDHVHVVAVERGTGRITETLRAALRRRRDPGSDEAAGCC
ncbi:MAG: hypothetical protein IT200_13555 [Thermoleophilia bacterium]|nr:hypothetical protein [Thermoleophilia bacterium]